MCIRDSSIRCLISSVSIRMASSRDTFTFAEECKVAKVGCPNVFLVMLEYRMIRTRQFLCHIRHRDPLPEWGAYTPCRTSVYVSRCGVSRATQCGPGALIFSTTSWRVGRISWMYKVWPAHSQADLSTKRDVGSIEGTSWMLSSAKSQNGIAQLTSDDVETLWQSAVSYTHLTLPTIYSV
mgnify:FL=1